MRIVAMALGLAGGLAFAGALASPAAADGWRGRGHGWKHQGHGHHHHGHYGHRRHGGASVFFSFRPAPRYEDPYYYRERRVVVIERPVVVERPIVVERPVQAPPGLDLGREVTDGSGRYCREYQTTGRIAGKVEQLWGVACLQPDGSWELAG